MRLVQYYYYPHLFLLCFKILFIYFILKINLFLKRGREGKREGNISVWLPFKHPPLGMWPSTQACDLTGDWTGTGDLSGHKPVLSALSHTSQCSKLIFISSSALKMSFHCLLAFSFWQSFSIIGFQQCDYDVPWYSFVFVFYPAWFVQILGFLGL